MKYVYILESVDGEHFYVGLTDDLRARLAKHNAGEVPHTSKFRPWRLKTYIAFSDPDQAVSFEKYLKSGSGPRLREEALLTNAHPICASARGMIYVAAVVSNAANQEEAHDN